MKRRLLLAAVFASVLLRAADLTVMAVADSHADMAGWDRIAPMIVAERARAGAENTLLIDAGDTLYGSFAGSFRNGEIPLAVLNFLRFDVWVPGNHDFAFRPFRFRDFRGAVLGGDWKTADFTPSAWRMFTRAGRRIAVIGLGETGMAKRLLPGSGVAFADRDAVLTRAVREALDGGAELLIFVRHDGLYAPGGHLHKLLRRHPEIALTFGAHTHQEIAGKRVGRTWYVQPGSHGRCLGIVRVRFPEGAGEPAIASELRRPVSGDAAMVWPEEIAAMREVARRQAAAPAGRSEKTLAPPDDRDFSGGLGDLIERALRAETGAEVVLAAQYRTPGVVGTTEPTREDFFRLLPHEGRICRVDLTPAELETAVRDLVRLQRRRRNLAVRFGGLRVYRDKRGELRRVVMPGAGPDGRIPVALTDYELAGCGGGMPGLFAGRPWRDTGVRLRDAALRLLNH